MAKKELKTNVMRVLDSKKLAYNHYTYDNSTVNGVEVARLLGQEPDRGGRNAAPKRAAAPHRLCARRLLAHWDEKAVPHLYPPNGGGL